MSIFAFCCAGRNCFPHFFFILLTLLIADAQPPATSVPPPSPTFPARHCPTEANNTASPTFENNLRTLFNGRLYDKERNSVYSNRTYGEDPNKVYSNYICRFDFTPKMCEDCVNNAIKNILDQCNGTREAVLWYPTCMIRYSNKNIFSTLELTPTIYAWNSANITRPIEFAMVLNESFAELNRTAALNPSRWAIQERDISQFEQLYSLAQCTEDLSVEDCRTCLTLAFSLVTRDNVQGMQGGRVLIPSCFIRFELFRFYELPEASSPSGVFTDHII